MNKIYQTNLTIDKGNCMQAALATLLEMPLVQIPNIIELPDDTWFQDMSKFLNESGYMIKGILYNKEDSRLRSPYQNEHKEYYQSVKHEHNELERLIKYPGVKGYFFASVYSPKYYIKGPKPIQHAVVIDEDFNIVHDPNPNNKDVKEYPCNDELGYNGVFEVYLIQKIRKHG